MRRCFYALAVLTALALATSAAYADRDLFEIEAMVGGSGRQGGDNQLVDLIDAFIHRGNNFSGLPSASNVQGDLSYLGIERAVEFFLYVNGSDLVTQLDLTIPATGTAVTFAGNADQIQDQVEDWLKKEGISEWADFLRAANGRTPLALISGNPRSTVALMGDSAYRKFGVDDSRSRMGFGKPVQRWGSFELRADAGISSVNTATFNDSLWTLDPSITLAGDLGRYLGLSLSMVGQYRDYNGAQMADLGFEVAIPVTLKRPDRGPYFWQLTPFVQVAGGASKDAAAGGLFVGGGLVNALGYNHGRYEILMANEIAYYDGVPIEDIGGYDFQTELSQAYFKNGLEGTYWLGGGLYADAGVHFTNFARDRAAVSWYVTPTVGVGWQAGRWMDIRVGYEADLDNDDYKAHNVQAKLDLLF